MSMREKIWRLVLAPSVILLCIGGSSPADDLTFTQRVAAQRAIERVYYSHQVGATRSFDEAVPQAVLERKVLTYLRQSAMLERRWNTPVTAGMLRSELLRMRTGTRLPERLREIERALGDDTFLIEETVARAALVDRLSRRFFAADERIHGVAATGAEVPSRKRVTWDAWFEDTARDLDLGDVRSIASVSLGRTPADDAAAGPAAAACLPDDTWDNGILDDVPVGRTRHTAVWTGSLMIVWGGSSRGSLDDGSRYDPATDTWSSTSRNNAPSARESHTAVWTGSEMIVWGGTTGVFMGETGTGGRYDPVSDTWTPTNMTGAPLPQSGHTAVWTGDLMLVWGGGGARYDPATDTWSPISMTGAPSPRQAHTAVWTGSEMIVWGGSYATVYGDGARYDPATDTWERIADFAAPAARFNHSAVWTSSEMIVWGGSTGPYTDVNTGARYHLASDTWTPMTTIDAPEIRQRHSAVWTGSRMIVWGGVRLPCCDFTEPRDTGGLYDPATDTWSETSLTNAPSARDTHTAVWTGALMIVWGGQQTVGTFSGTQATPQGTGARYDPLADAWTPTSLGGGPAGGPAVWTGSEMIVWGGNGPAGRYNAALDTWTSTSTAGAPTTRSGHSAIWSGSEMIVWGGSETGTGRVNTGARYNPMSDAWTPVSTGNAPLPRNRHTAVWAGTRMIVWGGQTAASTPTDTGGRYDPLSDSWAETSLALAPTARDAHTAVWTGAEMVVWGGSITTSPFKTNTGGRYDPLSDSWAETSLALAPTARDAHTAVWTGAEMVVWGGSIRTSPFFSNTGARYDPGTDTWVATTATGAPAARSAHTAVWADDAMVVWGGTGNTVIGSTGGRYDPDGDSWLPTSTVGAPAGRSGHAAVWTGSMMLVYGGRPYTGGRYLLNPPVDDDLDGFTVCGGDCDDTDPSVHPGAVELPGNAIDENCDGARSCDPSLTSWPRHGAFVRCVARECDRLVAAGDVTRSECDAIVSSAGNK